MPGFSIPKCSGVRKRLAKRGINLEWLGGARIIRFGMDSNTRGDAFREEMKFIPSIGMRVGFKIF